MIVDAVAVASDIKQRMDALRITQSGRVVAEYLKEKLGEQTTSLLSCNKETFEAQKGRCLELKDLITYIESRG